MGHRRLVIVSERDHGYLDLDGRSSISIGRSPENDVVVKDDMVSRRHAQLEVSAEGALRVRDLKSFNGTYLNERRVRDEGVGLWDAVRVGRTKLILVERAETPAGEPSGAAVAAVPGDDAPPAAEAAADEGERDMGATRTLDVQDGLASKEMRALVEGIVRNERAALEQEICRRVRDESGPSVLASLSGHRARVRRVGPADGGGDFYDVFRDAILPDDLFLALGSVSGVGIAACVAATSARHALRGACAPRGDVEPRPLLDALREVLARTLHPGSAVSLLLARLHTDGAVRLGATGGTGALHYQAARDEVLVLRAPGRRDEEAARPEALELTLGEGDRLVLVSDGAGSLRDRQGVPFGSARLKATLREEARLPAKELAKALSEQYVAFAAGAPERDVTVLVLSKAEG